MGPRDLSRQLRQGPGECLGRRRGIVGLSLLAAASMGLLTLYQVGIIRHVPEPPLPGFDADKVDASEEAYAMLETPDAALGLVSYAVTAALAAAGGPDRASERPWLPLALAGKLGIDAFQAGKLTYDQWAKHRAFCSWCLLAAGATFASVPLVVPEALAALRRLVRKGS
ncbi:MAG: vitamin K epoxide reductase [Isosphaeraceae bacterium]|nr:vitamin K epoxide reductase [Isosphaeraceae bacterium]